MNKKSVASIDDLLAEYKNRPVQIAGDEILARRAASDQAEAMNRLEGSGAPTETARHIIDLWASGHISNEEYLNLCRRIMTEKPAAPIQRFGKH